MFFYLPFFLKIYCLENHATFTALSPIAFAPALLLYWHELAKLFILHNKNIAGKKDYL